jgi:hypothetical protein
MACTALGVILFSDRFGVSRGILQLSCRRRVFRIAHLFRLAPGMIFKESAVIVDGWRDSILSGARQVGWRRVSVMSCVDEVHPMHDRTLALVVARSPPGPGDGRVGGLCLPRRSRLRTRRPALLLWHVHHRITEIPLCNLPTDERRFRL